MGKIIMTLAMSLDGFIADENGGFDWIAGQGNGALDTEFKFDFGKFLEDIDLVIMGNNCYKEGHAKDYTIDVWVATREEKADEGDIKFVGGDIVGAAESEKAAGKNVYIFGGGVLADAFLKADAIDEYIIGVVPVILGKGRPLFLPDSPMGNTPKIPLELTNYAIEDGIINLYYKKRTE